MINDFLVLIRNLRLQDVLDIAIIAIMIAALLVWFKDRASRFVLAGIGLIGLVYLLALFFQLYLTTMVLQGFFAIFLFLLVVIFQEDLRRLFERLAIWVRLKKNMSDRWPGYQTAEIIANSVVSLAKKRIGALIVISGNDLLDRHLSGGTVLDGQLSQLLLESIFDPNSPGHDGAVVIEGNKVAKFGCHLPLSSHAGSYENLGLRHTAALGLAERSDAICIVVSEERGTISIAEGENLSEAPNVSALGAALESFYFQKAPIKKTGQFFLWLKENQREKIIALSLACVLWFVFGYQRESIRRDFTVPIDYKNVSAEWVLEEPKIAEAKVTLMGPAQVFRLFDEKNLKISLDLSQLRRGANDISFTKEMLNVPSNLAIAGISPRNIRIYASKMVSVRAAVEVVTENRPPRPYVIERIVVTPPKISLLTPAKYQTDSLKIKTEPVNLRHITGTTKISPRLILPPGVHYDKEHPPSVTVLIKVKRKSR